MAEIKKKPGRKPIYIHKCSEREQLERMRVILVGPNGDPKLGLAFKMEQTIGDITEIKGHISDIKDQLKETINAASTASSSLEKYKIEVKSYEAGKDDTEEKQLIADELKARLKKEVEDRDLIIVNLKAQKISDHWQRTMWVIMAVVAIISVLTGLYFGFKGLNKRFNNMRTPFVTNSRGQPLDLPDSSKILFWPNDSIQYVIKRIK